MFLFVIVREEHLKISSRSGKVKDLWLVRGIGKGHEKSGKNWEFENRWCQESLSSLILLSMKGHTVKSIGIS